MEKEVKNFELLVRALIIKNGKILLCKTKGRDYYFLPGGHVEFGEKLSDALNRELKEEMNAKVIDNKFIGGVENLFDQNGELIHEISFLFFTDIEGDAASIEEHIDFFWLTYDDFEQVNMLPFTLKEAIIEWTQTREVFFKLQ